MKGSADSSAIASQIHSDLCLNNDWYEECQNSHDAFSLIRSRLEDCGVLVMISGIVGQNTRRALKIEEFRAFASIDDWAPLIFINAADSEGAKLFSLMHEAAHIWIGENDLYNGSTGSAESVKPLEKTCNAAAAELLAPAKAFKEKWDDSKKDVFEEISVLSKYFCCGESVIAGRALDYGKINKEDYNKVVQTAIEHYRQMKKKKKNGG